VIKAPAKDLPEAPQSGRRKKTKKNIELSFCRSVIRELKKKTHWPYAYPFYEPVDAEKLRVPDYYKVIKHPMDLATINSKLENDQYANAEEFEEDIRLMFRNCYTYNGVGSEVYNMGKTLEAVFNKKWAEKPVPQSKQKGKTKVSRDDEEFDIKKKSLKRPRGGKQRDDGLSNDQKAFLSSRIELLTDTDMNQLINLLRESGVPLQVNNHSRLWTVYNRKSNENTRDFHVKLYRAMMAIMN
jgi:bromodomain-containing factor 1